MPITIQKRMAPNVNKKIKFNTMLIAPFVSFSRAK